MTDLKPCPFCGKAAIMLRDDGDGRSGEWWGVGCFASTGDEDCPGFKTSFRSNEAAIGIWNRRAHDASETAALRKVRDLMDTPTIGWPDKRMVVIAVLDAILEARK